jgi:hypothetical protein
VAVVQPGARERKCRAPQQRGDRHSYARCALARM